MKVTVNGITFEGSEDEVKRMVEWQEKRMSTPTCGGGGSSAGDMPKAPYEVTMSAEETAPSAKSEGGEFVSAAEASSVQEKRTCPRGRQSCNGCEYLLGQKCRAVCYPTYPPKYDDCVFLGGQNIS